MGRQHTPAQSQDTESEFQDASDAYDQIAPFFNAQFEFREQGINQICNQLNQVDQPSLGMQLLKSGLKLGLAAAAGAVGAATGGLGWVALGAIGLGFGIGGELVDAAFSGPSAPAGIEEFRTQRLNVHIAMKARELSTLRTRLNSGNADQWARAKTDYENMQQNAQLQRLEADATLDAWMNGISQNAHGSGGWMGEGTEELNSITTGRLHLQGHAFKRSSGVSVSVRSATLDGLENATLRNRYIDRPIRDIGLFTQFAFPLRGEWGGVGFQAGNDIDVMIQGGQRWKSSLGYMTVNGPTATAPNHDWGSDAVEGARLVANVLRSWTLRDFNISSIGDGGSFE